MSDAIETVLAEGYAARTYSCAAWSTGTAERVDSSGVLGELSWGGPPAGRDTLWDLASVTKPIVALAVMSLVQGGMLTLDDTIGQHLADFRGTDKEQLTLRQLLTHTSGYPAETPMYRWCTTREAMLDEIRGMSLRFAPGTDVEYTSQGFIVLGLIVESVTGAPLHEWVRRSVTQPAGMPNTGYLLGAAQRERAAATEDCPWRGRVVQGTVHDENAEVLGGVAGHAGLFATLADLQSLAQLLCRGTSPGGTGTPAGSVTGTPASPGGPVTAASAGGSVTGTSAGGTGADTAVLSARTLATMIAPATDHLRLRRTLGWQGREPVLSSAGDLSGPRTFGHTGFTGTSLWVDPDCGRYVVLLTNRVHPTRSGPPLARIRRQVHNIGFGMPAAPEGSGA